MPEVLSDVTRAASPPWRMHGYRHQAFWDDADMRGDFNTWKRQQRTWHIQRTERLDGATGRHVVAWIGNKGEDASGLALITRRGGRWRIADRIYLAGCHESNDVKLFRLGSSWSGLLHRCLINWGSGVGGSAHHTLFTVTSERFEAIDDGAEHCHTGCENDACEKEVRFEALKYGSEPHRIRVVKRECGTAVDVRVYRSQGPNMAYSLQPRKSD